MLYIICTITQFHKNNFWGQLVHFSMVVMRIFVKLTIDGFFQMKRLEIMELKWNEGLLNYPIEKGLVNLAKSVRNSNYDEAEKIQVNETFLTY